MALNHIECQEMISACRSAGVPLFVAYYRRALPRFLKVKELIESGAIGDVRFVTVTLYRKPTQDELDPHHLPWRVVPEIAGGGNFFDLAPHTLDFLDFCLGPIRSVQGMTSNQGKLYRAEDMVSGTFVFDSGVHSVGVWSFAAFQDYDMNEIVGSRGKVAFSTFGLEPVVLTTPEGVTKFPIPHPPHIQQPLIQTIVNELNGLGQCPSTGVTGARTAWVMDEMVKG